MAWRQLFQNTASALPAELGPDGTAPAVSQPYCSRAMRLASPSRAARAWAKRLAAGQRRRRVRALPTLPCSGRMPVAGLQASASCVVQQYKAPGTAPTRRVHLGHANQRQWRMSACSVGRIAVAGLSRMVLGAQAC